jgi:hypothetical protein
MNIQLQFQVIQEMYYQWNEFYFKFLAYFQYLLNIAADRFLIDLHDIFLMQF